MQESKFDCNTFDQASFGVRLARVSCEEVSMSIGSGDRDEVSGWWAVGIEGRPPPSDFGITGLILNEDAAEEMALPTEDEEAALLESSNDRITPLDPSSPPKISFRLVVAQSG